MSYIMITNWSNHWDKIPHNSTTYYNLTMLRGGLSKDKVLSLSERISTLFIKRFKDKPGVEKAWVGYSSGFQYTDTPTPCIRFTVEIDKEVPCPQTHLTTPTGWYPDGEDTATRLRGSEVTTTNQQKYLPPFIEEISRTSDWQTFEDGVYDLLCLLGIHKCWRFDSKNQAGKADGVFVFENLAVIYDCTLNPNFESSKEVQVENYIHQLQRDRIKLGTTEVPIGGKRKYVWIISRGSASRELKKIEDIVIKEIPVASLIKIYLKRFRSTWDERELARKLEDL